MESITIEQKQTVRFNYIITIHNKQDLIEKVLHSIIRCTNENSFIYPVLDGCTDNTEKIIDRIIKDNPGLNIKKIYQDDVHELKSINAGVLASDQSENGYNIVLQDDVVFNDFDIENKIKDLYLERPDLGIVSFRHGGNINMSLLNKRRFFFPLKNYIESVLGHNPNYFNQLKIGYFVYREIAIKSPICIPFTVIDTIGLPDEDFAPWDDIDYCFRVSEHGFNNAVYALDIRSELEWGTTRIKTQKMSTSSVEIKNIRLFKEKNGHLLNRYRQRSIYKSKPINLTGNDEAFDIAFSFGAFKGKVKSSLRNLLLYTFNR